MSVSYEKYLTNAHIFKPGDERKKYFSNENLYILDVNLDMTVHLLLLRRGGEHFSCSSYLVTVFESQEYILFMVPRYSIFYKKYRE